MSMKRTDNAKRVSSTKCTCVCVCVCACVRVCVRSVQGSELLWQVGDSAQEMLASVQAQLKVLQAGKHKLDDKVAELEEDKALLQHKVLKVTNQKKKEHNQYVELLEQHRDLKAVGIKTESNIVELKVELDRSHAKLRESLEEYNTVHTLPQTHTQYISRTRTGASGARAHQAAGLRNRKSTE